MVRQALPEGLQVARRQVNEFHSPPSLLGAPKKAGLSNKRPALLYSSCGMLRLGRGPPTTSKRVHFAPRGLDRAAAWRRLVPADERVGG